MGFIWSDMYTYICSSVTEKSLCQLAHGLEFGGKWVHLFTSLHLSIKLVCNKVLTRDVYLNHTSQADSRLDQNPGSVIFGVYKDCIVPLGRII